MHYILILINIYAPNFAYKFFFFFFNNLFLNKILIKNYLFPSSLIFTLFNIY